MKVYILTKIPPYESMEIVSVFTDESRANSVMSKLKDTFPFNYYLLEEFETDTFKETV